MSKKTTPFMPAFLMMGKMNSKLKSSMVVPPMMSLVTGSRGPTSLSPRMELIPPRM
ncbi:MAG: hypothetical protein IPI61_10300 [Syntrophaceae bacterium]|nr:hypothetical protein [Syntrophaceae bacterium]